MNYLFFYLSMSCILLHELDAMRCHEWRIFPGLSLLPDRWAMPLFVFLHLPLFVWIFYGIHPLTENFRWGFDLFFIIHFILHLLFLIHPKNEFKDGISWVIILGSAICGGIDWWWML